MGKTYIRQMDFELCAGSYSSALIANEYNFKRVELCASLSVGGLTPSPGTIVKTVKHVKAECHVLIRPRVGDFKYTEEEIEIMLADIEFCKTVGCAGVVFGVLNQENRFDLAKNITLLDAAGGLQTTFHRAIDDSSDYQADIESIINCGFDRILTAGGANSANAGITQLKHMRELTKESIELMIGGGITAENIAQLQHEIKPDAIHFSGTEKIISGAGGLFEAIKLETSSQKVQRIFQAIQGNS